MVRLTGDAGDGEDASMGDSAAAAATIATSLITAAEEVGGDDDDEEEEEEGEDEDEDPVVAVLFSTTSFSPVPLSSHFSARKGGLVIVSSASWICVASSSVSTASS